MIELMGKPEGISIEANGDLPTLTTYSAPLEQVFRNLIGNAVKHHPGPKGKVSIACEEAEDHYLFSVADDGATPKTLRGSWETDAFQLLVQNAVTWGLTR